MLKILVSDLSKKLSSSGTVAILGNFDGIHLGHINLLTKLNAIAQSHNYWRVVILFYPLTHEYLHRENKKSRISLLRDNVLLLKQAQLVDEIVVLHFNQHLLQLTGDDFTADILVNKLHINHIVAGPDFSFGYKKSGNLETLHKYNIKTTVLPPYQLNGVNVSSSLIRTLLAEKKFDQAVQYLGHSITYTGRVVYGQQLGRTAQIPTVNLNIPNIIPALQGVFLSFVYIDNTRYNAVSNIGTRPTVDNSNCYKIEAHLLNANVNCYNKIARVEFIKFVRDEEKFNTSEEMFTQIKKDVEYAQQYFKTL